MCSEEAWPDNSQMHVYLWAAVLLASASACDACFMDFAFICAASRSLLSCWKRIARSCLCYTSTQQWDWQTEWINIDKMMKYSMKSNSQAVTSRGRLRHVQHLWYEYSWYNWPPNDHSISHITQHLLLHYLGENNQQNITFLSKAVLLLNQNNTQNIFCPHFCHYVWQLIQLSIF